jgi:pimeloyl-ACP methyl ester carboxylesterase
VLRPASFFAASSEASDEQHELVEMESRYRTLGVPVSVLFARQDRILDPETHGAGLALAVPGVQLDLIDGGHMFPLTSPRETADWIAARFA